MGRTRFMVVKAKELIKTAVFAVLGVIILVGLIAFFLNMGKHDGAYRDGTYYEEMQLGEETAEIAVTIAEGRIAEVSMEEATEAVAVFYPLLAEVTETVGQAVIENQSQRLQWRARIHILHRRFWMRWRRVWSRRRDKRQVEILISTERK